ncbi:hypothetical protein MOMA_07571 [Moraxella macacae 0408225]|uniref:CTP synthetase n=1 Tax=Moraxella macacae 0408225 TaxID=1230338 RepID=L2F5U5_9GAMM|nr:hypothetical protein [Moraxella macacae]ELA08402.1 hypothetical protein MOMA_07571 [Moraxella macacae 0408225]
MNWQLFSVISSIASTVLAGILITVALVIGFDEIPHIIMAGVGGIVVSFPVAFVLTKKIQTLGMRKE